MARVSSVFIHCIVLCIGIASLSQPARGQREYDVWHFGAGYILDFRSGTPTASTGSWIWQDEGCAVWCDRRTGGTMFYTNGIDVYNRNNQLMPNGSGLYGHESAVQSALIVPVPCDTNRYYLFTADQMGYVTTGPAPRGLNYSIVDMRLQGGLGDITSKNTPLLNPASERLTAVAHANGYDYWVIGHSKAANTFYAWRVTGAGISAPVTSVVGVNQGPTAPLAAAFTLGALKASPNGRKLAMTTYSLNMVELFDFDPSTGRVSNGITVYQGTQTNTITPVYGVTFSPDNTKLYLAALGILQQYDVTLATPAAIIASGMAITPSDAPAANVSGFMQIGPDGKVYIVHDSLWVGVVNNPNARGNACGYTSRRYQYPWMALFLHGLPNNIDAKATTVMSDSSAVRISPAGPLAICEGGSATFSADPGFVTYRWSTGATTRQITVTRAGTYSVTVTDSLGCTAQGAVELRVNPLPQPVISGSPQFCQGDSVVLRVTQPFAQYQWSTGATTRQITVRMGGTFRVTVTDTNGCTGDTVFTVRMNPRPIPRITGDLEICDNERSVLDAGAGYAAYLWSTGKTTRMIDVRDAGRYWVEVTDSNGCKGADTVDLIVHPLPDPRIVPSKLRFCDGDSARLVVSDTGVNAGATWRWSTGETGRSIVVRTGGLYHVEVTTPFGCVGMDSVMIQVDPNPKPTISISPSATLCEGDSAVLDAGPGYAAYRWSTGQTTRTIVVRQSGEYGVEVTDVNGCRGTAEPVRIDVFSRPDVSISGPRRVCPDRTATYSVPVESGAAYNWAVSSGGILLAGQGTSQITIRWTTSGTERVSVRVVTGAGCADSASINVVVNDDLHPVITPDRDPRLCDGDSVTLTGDAGYAEYRWSTGETTRRIVARSSGTYTLFVTDSMGCSGTSDPVVVVVNPNPTPIITPLGSVDLCDGDSVVLDAGPFAQYVWSTGETTRRITIRSAGTYGVRVVDVNGCTGTSPTIDVTVTPVPNPAIEGPRLVCRYSVIDYRVMNEVPGNSYVWRVTGGTILDGQGKPRITIKWGGGGTGTIDVVERTPNGCEGNAETVAVIIGDVLQPVITASRPTTICDGDSVTLDAGAGYDSYLWSTGETTRTIVVRRPGRYSVRVAESSGCAGSSAEIEVTFNPNPRPSIAGRLHRICVGESVALDAPDGFLSYRWSTGETTRSISVYREGVYFVEVVDANGCVGVSLGDTVIVLAPPSKPIISAVGDLLTSTPAATYQWSNEGKEISGATGRTHRALLPGIYTVAITDSNGCRAVSDPVRLPIARIVYLDTVSAHVGDRVFVTMRIDPPLESTDGMTGFRIRLKLDPGSLFAHGVVSPGEYVAGEPTTFRRERDGTILLERPTTAGTLVGNELLRLTVEGLSTGVPANPVIIEKIDLRPVYVPGANAQQLGSDSVIVAGHGLVLLTGCDIAHGFGVGKRAAITGVNPNPVRDGMTVSWRAPEGAHAVLTLIDVTGRPVRWIDLPTGTGSEQQIALDVLTTPSGAYMLELRDGLERMSVPIVVVR